MEAMGKEQDETIRYLPKVVVNVSSFVIMHFYYLF